MVIKRCLKSGLDTEIEILNILRGDNDKIVHIKDTIGKLYIIYDYTSGFVDLYKYLSRVRRKSIRLSESDIYFIMIQIVDSLIYIHSKNILHLDIKQENIIINKYIKHIKIIDFGLSSIMDRVSKSTTKSYCGTKGYACPSLVRHTQCVYTPAIDIYSLGKTFEDIIRMTSVTVSLNINTLIKHMTGAVSIRPTLEEIRDMIDFNSNTV